MLWIFLELQISHFALSNKTMTRITIYSASQTLDNKDCEGHQHYFTLTQAKVWGAVQLYECIGIDYVKKDVF